MAVRMLSAARRVTDATSGVRAAAGPDRAGVALLVALLAAIAYAAFARGAASTPDETWLQVGLAALTIVAAGAWLWDGGMRLRAPALAWAGCALLAAFAAWSALSLLWSVSPDDTWTSANRAFAYALVALLAIAAGASHARAVERLAVGYLIVAVLVALYAFGGKATPGIHIPGLFDLDQTRDISRLRAPLQYWNALALVCVLAVPIALRFAAAAARRRVRLASLAALYLLLTVIGLTYSRGGIVVLAVAVIASLALGGARLRSLALLACAGMAVVAPLAVAFTSTALTANVVPLEARSHDGLHVLAAFGAGLAALLLAGWAVERLAARISWGPRQSRMLVRVTASFAVLVVLLGALGAARSERGLGGTVRHAVDGFTQVRGDAVTDPARLLSTSSGNRWTWWREAAGAWSDRPLAGWGAGSFPVTHRLYRTDSLDVRQPHSVPLQLLAETGLVGLLLALGGCGLLLAAAFRVVRALPPGPSRGLAAALAAGGLAWLLHGFYDWDWDIPGVTVPALAFMGVLAARVLPRARSEADADAGRGAWTSLAAGLSPGARALALGGATALLGLLALSAVLPAWSQSKASDALDALPARPSPKQLERAAAQAELAARLNPLSDEPLMRAASIAERRGRLLEARDALLRATEREPYDGNAWLRLARLEFVRQDAAGFERAAMRALALDPENPFTRAFAARAQAALALPNDSPTATGTPLPGS
jgi:hypothetical protein